MLSARDLRLIQQGINDNQYIINADIRKISYKYKSLREMWDKMVGNPFKDYAIKIANNNDLIDLKYQKELIRNLCNQCINSNKNPTDQKILSGYQYILDNLDNLDNIDKDKVDSIFWLANRINVSVLKNICRYFTDTFSSSSKDSFNWLIMDLGGDPEKICNLIRESIPNPFIPEVERLKLDKDTADPWTDILEEL